jgi:hypothetical protein
MVLCHLAVHAYRLSAATPETDTSVSSAGYQDPDARALASGRRQETVMSCADLYASCHVMSVAHVPLTGREEAAIAVETVNTYVRSDKHVVCWVEVCCNCWVLQPNKLKHCCGGGWGAHCAWRSRRRESMKQQMQMPVGDSDTLVCRVAGRARINAAV